jgi:hypothetical protein
MFDKILIIKFINNCGLCENEVLFLTKLLSFKNIIQTYVTIKTQNILLYTLYDCSGSWLN